MSADRLKARPRRRKAAPAEAPRGNSRVATASGKDPQKLVTYYRQMLLIRRFEEKTAELYTRARIGGYCHLNLGEEATVVGLMAALSPKDYIYTNYREHGYLLARGADPRRVMAELLGKETGVSKGRGGSMHLFDIQQHFMGGYAIVGAQLPLAIGTALAVRYRNSDEIVLCQMGDGTTNIGAFHETLNIAQLWELPVVFVVINNQYGMGTRVEKASAVPELFRKACAYDMQSRRVDGNDVMAVLEAAQWAVKLARREHAPSLLESVSYRFRGHSVVDPARYRDPDEVKQAQARDPLTVLGQRLVDERLLDRHGLDEVEAWAEGEVREAEQFAESSPDPLLEDLFRYVYATPVANGPGPRQE